MDITRLGGNMNDQNKYAGLFVQGAWVLLRDDRQGSSLYGMRRPYNSRNDHQIHYE
jgi:hypothetical protein